MKLVTEKDIVHRVGCTKEQLNEFIQSKMIPSPFGTIGRERVWTKESLEDFITEYSFMSQYDAAKYLEIDPPDFYALVRNGVMPKPRHLKTNGKEQRMYTRKEVVSLKQHWKEVKSLAKDTYKEAGLWDATE